MKRATRSLLSTVTYGALRLTRGRERGLRILMYHRVTDAHPTDRLCVPVARFEEQMRWLAEHGYRTMRVAEAVEWIGSNQQSPPHRSVRGADPPPAEAIGNQQLAEIENRQSAIGNGRVVITFDDGFEDNFLYAAPAMARHGFMGSFFVPSGFIEAGADRHPAPDRPMTWQQLRELIARGHEIGAHSISHAKLTTVDVTTMQREIRGSKEALEQQLQRPVECFCYPSGDYDDTVKRAVAESGYRGACTVEPGANVLGADPFALKRTEVSAFDSLWDFEKKLAGAYDWMHRFVQKAQR